MAWCKKCDGSGKEIYARDQEGNKLYVSCRECDGSGIVKEGENK